MREIDVADKIVASSLDRFDQHVSVNVAYLVPHNAVRIGAIGWDDRTATPAELDCMHGLVQEGMQDGAFGVSTGLTYSWLQVDQWLPDSRRLRPK